MGKRGRPSATASRLASVSGTYGNGTSRFMTVILASPASKLSANAILLAILSSFLRIGVTPDWTVYLHRAASGIQSALSAWIKWAIISVSSIAGVLQYWDAIFQKRYEPDPVIARCSAATPSTGSTTLRGGRWNQRMFSSLSAGLRISGCRAGGQRVQRSRCSCHDNGSPTSRWVSGVLR
jgi:hypothetical protein